MLIVNMKAYGQANGTKSVEIAKACERAASETGKKVIAAPQHTDLLRVENAEIEIFGQHLDPVKPGSQTGHTTAEALKAANCSGTLINHSERRISPEKIEESIERARKNDLTTVVCAQDPEECEKYSRYRPDFIAYEPPELIGGDTSVSEAKAELIKQAVERSEVDVLTGAGIKTKGDVEKSIELGCQGVLVASGVVKSDKPEKAAKELCEGL